MPSGVTHSCLYSTSWQTGKFPEGKRSLIATVGGFVCTSGCPGFAALVVPCPFAAG